VTVSTVSNSGRPGYRVCAPTVDLWYCYTSLLSGTSIVPAHQSLNSTEKSINSINCSYSQAVYIYFYAAQLQLSSVFVIVICHNHGQANHRGRSDTGPKRNISADDLWPRPWPRN